MIDKELIRQAAEDIDIFEADLSQEFDRIAYPRKSLRLWPWAAVAACLVAVVGVSLPMLIGTDKEKENNITEVRSQTEGKLVAQVYESDNNTAIAPSPTPAVTETTHSRLPQKVRTVLPATPVRTEPKTYQESTEANEIEMMCELLDEVTQQTIVEEKYEEHLVYTLMEEICRNASNEPNIPELSL